MRELSGVWKMSKIWIGMVVTQVFIFVKTHGTVYLKFAFYFMSIISQ